ncbi:unnamed protein product, partial [Allacma fusca]
MRSRSSSSTGPNVGLGATSTSSTTSAPSSTLGYRSRLPSSNGELTTCSGTE